MKFFPKQIDFFEVFDRIAQNITHAGVLLIKFLETPPGEREQLGKEIREAEHEGDILTHEIIRQLNKTFITPIDREDLHALASRLDDVLDLMWSVVDRITLFKVIEIMPEAIVIANDLHQAAYSHFRAHVTASCHENFQPFADNLRWLHGLQSWQ